MRKGKVLDLDISLKGKKMEIEDINNRKYIVKNIKDFVKHISKYHGSADLLHEKNEYYFLINDELRTKLKIIENEK